MNPADRAQPSTDPPSPPTPEGTAARIWQPLVLTLLTHAARPLQAISRPAALRFGTGLGRFAHLVALRQRRRAENNLRLAFGDTMTARRRSELTRQVFEHYGRSIVDFVRAPGLTPLEVDQLVTCDDWHHVEAAIREEKGVILVTGHLGNWEILGRWLADVKHLPLTVVAKDPKNPAFARYVRRMREGAGFAVLSKGESARSLVQVLKRHEAICLLADQSSADVFTPFFGIPTGTVVGPASLALRTGAPVLSIYCVQEKDGRFRMLIRPPLPVPTEGDRKQQVRCLTAALNRELEAVIREYPDQWLWLHNRWKATFDARFRAQAWGDQETGDSASCAYDAAFRRWSGL